MKRARRWNKVVDPISTSGLLPGVEERVTQRLSKMLKWSNIDELLEDGYVIYFNDDGWLDVRRKVGRHR